MTEQELQNISHYPFTSESGDLYLIPAQQYDKEVTEYRNSDGDDMMRFETGETGWICFDSVIAMRAQLNKNES